MTPPEDGKSPHYDLGRSDSRLRACPDPAMRIVARCWWSVRAGGWEDPCTLVSSHHRGAM